MLRRRFFQPGRTQLVLKVAELLAEVCRRITLAASRGYRWSRPNFKDSRAVCPRRICRQRRDLAYGVRDL
jgi:hypothetical protein